MKYTKRKGFALIYTVLIGALVFVSIMALSIKLIPENTITKARTNSQRALTAAESGIAQILLDLRSFNTNNNFDPNSGSNHYLSAQEIMNLIDSTSNQVIPSNPQEMFLESTGSYKTSFQGKIKVLTNDTANKVLSVELYVLGIVKDSGNNPIAKEAIKTSFSINYSKDPNYTKAVVTTTTNTWVPETPSGIFNYALFSGGDIVFGGGAQAVDGSIHSVGIIDLGNAPKQVRVSGGDAEAEKNVTGSGVVTGKIVSSASKVSFPELNVTAYKGLADAFRLGQPPYDGSNPNFPNLKPDNESRQKVLLAIQQYLGAAGTSSDLSGISRFYSDLKSGTLSYTVNGKTNNLTSDDLAAANLSLATAKNIVYYIQGDVHINGNFQCIGTLVVDGNLVINGNSTIGDPNDPGAAAILVSGNIDLSNGNADLYGLFYANGSITGRGNFYCEGSIATKGSMDLKGNYTVKYHNITNENLGVSQPGYWKQTTETHEEQTLNGYNYQINSAAGGGISQQGSNFTWVKISYDKFLNP